VKCIGLFVYSLDREEYMVSVRLGFLIFSTICFLINQLVSIRLEKERISFPGKVINIAWIATGICTIYSLSPRIRDSQVSVFDTQPFIIVLLVLFLLVATALFLALWLVTREKAVVGLSGVIFLVCVVILFLAGPRIHWVVYSLAFNALLLLIIVSIIVYSVRINSTILANAAIIVFAVQVITRYFDVFWELLSGSLLFIITGIFALGGGWLLEKNRRQLILKLQKSESRGD
jgi:hypothetical protein